MKKLMLILGFVFFIYAINMVNGACGPPDTPEKKLGESTTVFIGKLTGLLGIPNSPNGPIGGYTYTYDVIKIYKGDVSNNVSVIFDCDDFLCGKPYEINEEYLIYAYLSRSYRGNDSFLRTGGCGANKLLSQASEEIKELESLISKRGICKNLYWFDNDNKECGLKEFCGSYMYQGLQTFESRMLCEKALNIPECVKD
ncbi:MAG: hypothetical protein AABX73_00070, partial [Nanoarchaeota archaeon]